MHQYIGTALAIAGGMILPLSQPLGTPLWRSLALTIGVLAVVCSQVYF